MKFSIIIPARNEQSNIEKVIKSIEENVGGEYEIIVVDDHSTDKTANVVELLALHYKNIYLVHNIGSPGFANCLKTGFNNAKTDVVLPVMADLCDDPKTINEMYKKILDGFDIVCGSRYTKGGKRLGGHKLKGFLSCIAGCSLYYLLGIPTHDIANAFKMYRKETINSIQLNAGGFEISMEIPLKAYYLGFKITEVPTAWKERTTGKSSFKIFKLLPQYLKLYNWAIFKKIIQ